VQVLLQHRALWSDQGGTWGVPGGALRPGEDPVAGALREAAEEAGVDPAGVRVVATHVLDHGVWRYTTVLGRVTGPQDPRPTDAESLEIAWVDDDAVADLPLLVAFGAAWPHLRRLLAG
jgi:8-oxo-dGTP pyrophosphatase MutT (NUDIX family)